MNLRARRRTAGLYDATSNRGPAARLSSPTVATPCLHVLGAEVLESCDGRRDRCRADGGGVRADARPRGRPAGVGQPDRAGRARPACPARAHGRGAIFPRRCAVGSTSSSLSWGAADFAW